MTSNIQIKRDYTGTMHMHVSGVPALGARVNGMNIIDGVPHFVVLVPTPCATLGEVDSVVPFPAVERK